MNRFVPLSKEQFKAVRWQRYKDYQHASESHLVAVSAPEVSRLAAQMPLVFVVSSQGNVTLNALTGLRPNRNHCLDNDYRWQLPYVPALWRAYPFRLLTRHGSDDNQRVLCVDVEGPCVSEVGEPFLTDSGEMTQPVKDVVDFLVPLTQHLQRTSNAAQALYDAGVLSEWKLTDHEGNLLQGLLRLDEKKLSHITPDALAQLQKVGALAIGYAQGLSTQHLSVLKRFAEQYDSDYTSIDLDAVFGEDGDELNFDFGS